LRGTAFLVVLYFGTIYDEIKFGGMDGEVGMGKAREVRENEGGITGPSDFKKRGYAYMAKWRQCTTPFC